MNSQGLLGLVNLLGEEIKSRNVIQNTVQEYSKLLSLIEETKVNSQISIKPTQLGLTIDFDYCLQNFRQIAEVCKSYTNWLWIDMESSIFTQKTIELYKQVFKTYDKIGLAIQANLKRSKEDLDSLLLFGAKIRLVKGAYNELPEIAYKKKEDIRKNFSKLLEVLFSQSENFFAIATHDSMLINKSRDLASSKRADFEFEMLMGVRDKLKFQLLSEKFNVREYIPYGPKWFSYSMRRLREKKSNILLMVRSLFG